MTEPKYAMTQKSLTDDPYLAMVDWYDRATEENFGSRAAFDTAAMKEAVKLAAGIVADIEPCGCDALRAEADGLRRELKDYSDAASVEAFHGDEARAEVADLRAKLEAAEKEAGVQLRARLGNHDMYEELAEALQCGTGGDLSHTQMLEAIAALRERAGRMEAALRYAHNMAHNMAIDAACELRPCRCDAEYTCVLHRMLAELAQQALGADAPADDVAEYDRNKFGDMQARIMGWVDESFTNAAPAAGGQEGGGR